MLGKFIRIQEASTKLAVFQKAAELMEYWDAISKLDSS
jgi:hypothetical protein